MVLLNPTRWDRNRYRRGPRSRRERWSRSRWCAGGLHWRCSAAVRLLVLVPHLLFIFFERVSILQREERKHADSCHVPEGLLCVSKQLEGIVRGVAAQLDLHALSKLAVGHHGVAHASHPPHVVLIARQHAALNEEIHHALRVDQRGLGA